MIEIANAIRFAAMLVVRAYAGRFISSNETFKKWIQDVKDLDLIPEEDQKRATQQEKNV